MKILLKDKKGITLQVLVIAIIVMIILSTVTLKIITRDDIADTASKSKFVTEVKQIYDKLQSKKVYLELDEEEEKKYDITLEDLDINEELINKYKGKIKIELGNLEKDVNLTEKEEKWLDEMNLQKEIIPYNKGILCALFSETSLDGKQSNSNSSTTPTTWFDETGNGNNGTITGYTWNGNGTIKTNYTTGNKLVIPNVLTGRKKYTIAICFYPVNSWGNGASTRYYFKYNNYRMCYSKGIFQFSDSTSINIKIENGTVSQRVGSLEYSYGTGIKTILVLSCDGNKIDFYSGNGETPTYKYTYTPNDTESLKVTTDLELINGVPEGTFYYALVWNRALSSEDISNLTPDFTKISDMK